MDLVLDSVIDAATAIVVALIGVGIISTRHRVKRVQEQVQNSHTTNLREELDLRHGETRAWFAYLKTRHDAVDGRMDSLERIVKQHHDDLDRLEDTVNPRKE